MSYRAERTGGKSASPRLTQAGRPRCRTQAYFAIRGDGLIPQRITSELGIKPSSASKKGDTRSTSRGVFTSLWGGWALWSKGHVRDRDVRRHLEYLLRRLEPVAHVIEKYKSDPSLDVFVRISFEPQNLEGGISVSADLLGRICRLCNQVGLLEYVEE